MNAGDIVLAIGSNPALRHAAERLVKNAVKHAAPELYEKYEHVAVVDALLKDLGGHIWRQGK